MAKQSINVGTSPNDNRGDSLRASFQKINANFTELYTALGLDVAPLNLGAFEFVGSTLSTTDSSAIVIDQAVTVSSNLTVGGDVLPNVALGGDLGSAARPWRSLYVSNNTIFLGGIALSVDSQGNLLVGGQSIADVGTAAWNSITGKPTFATVATTGAYADLTGKPTLFSGSYADLTNRPTLFSGSYADLTNKPNIAGTYQFSVAADDSTQRVISTDEVVKFVGAGGITTASDAEGRITITQGTTSSLVNSTKTVSLASTGILSLPAQAVPIQTFNQITTATINRTGASTDTDAIADARDNWLGAEYVWTEMVEQDHQISGYTWPWRGKPSWEGYPLLMNYNSSGPGAPTPPFGTLPPSSSLAPAGSTAINAYLAYKELASSIDIVSGNKTFSFENTGALRVPDIITRDNNLALVSTGATGVLPNGMAASVTADGQAGRVFIRTDSGTLRTWQFDANGVLTLPGNLTFPDLTVQTTAYIPGDIRSENAINIEINLSDSTLRRWQFGEDGKLTFPDGANYAGQTVTMPTTTIGNTNSFVWEFSDNSIGSDRITLNWNLLASDTAGFYIGTTHSTTGKYLFLDGTDQSLSYIAGGGLFGGGKLIFGSSAGNNAGDANAIEIKATNGDVYLTSTESVKITVDAADSSARIWTFDPTGSLTLPAGGVISEGGGLSGAIRLTPAGGANANQALLIYPTAGAPEGDHLHLTAGGGSTELYLGDDYHYVKLVDGGNVEVKATTANFSATAAWTFGTDGSLASDDEFIIKAPNGVPTSVYNYSGGGGWNSPPYTNLATTTNGSGTGLTVNVSAANGGYIDISVITINTPGTGYKTGDIITITNENNLIGTFAVGVAGTRSWTFGTGGDLTLPYGAVLRNTVGDAIAFGNGAGQNSQGGEAVAIGTNAGYDLQGIDAVAIGTSAGETDQGEKAVAIGDSAGYINQGDYAVAIGHGAGNGTQGSYAVAIGMSAGETTQAANSIIINATGATLNQTTANTFTVAPIRNISATSGVLQYNTSTKEVSYSNSVTAETFNTDQITVVGNRITTTVTNANLEIECNGTGGVVINTVAEATTASTSRAVGYLGMPQNAKSSSANTVIGDQGKHIYITGPTTITIDGSLAYPIGTTIAFINSTSTATIAITTDTMVLGGVGTTGSRSLAPYGMATAVKVAATTWYINGIGLT